MLMYIFFSYFFAGKPLTPIEEPTSAIHSPKITEPGGTFNANFTKITETELMKPNEMTVPSS